MKKEKSKKRNKILLSLVLIYALLWGGKFISSIPEKRAVTKMTNLVAKDFESLKSKCVTSADEATAISAGLARSSERGTAVQAYFVKVGTSPCYLSDDVVYSNPYKATDFRNLPNAKFGTKEYEVYQGLLYGYDLGFSPFTSGGTICADGWISSSVGQGSCSWHGGYAQARGRQLDFRGGQVIDSPGNDPVSEATGIGVGYSINLHPEISQQGLSSEFTCVSGLTKDSCFNYPNFNIQLCGPTKSANLEVLVDKWWRNAWTLEGVNSSQCGGDTPYLFEEAASTLRTYKMRLTFENGLEQNFEVNSTP
jgi:hypothetical protein